MRLLTKTVSCHPWTEGEMMTDLYTGPDGPGRRIFIRWNGRIWSGLVGFPVLVDNTLFPNFKEEINV